MTPGVKNAARAMACVSPPGALRAIAALILREIARTHGRAAGGYLWAVAEPVLGLVFLVSLFSIGFRTPPLGRDFAIFYASGLLPFLMFVSVANKVQKSLTFSRQLLHYPRLTPLDAILARAILAILTQAAISALILGYILLAHAPRVQLDLARLVLAFALAGGLGLAAGLMNCLIAHHLAFWRPLWSAISRPLMLVSGVIFLHERLPRPYADWLDWNPLVHVVGLARAAFYPNYAAAYVHIGYVCAVALGMALVGLLLLHAHGRDLAER